jgi:hypothetical protein
VGLAGEDDRAPTGVETKGQDAVLTSLPGHVLGRIEVVRVIQQVLLSWTSGLQVEDGLVHTEHDQRRHPGFAYEDPL